MPRNAGGCFYGGTDFFSQINDSKNWLAGVLWVSSHRGCGWSVRFAPILLKKSLLVGE
jgi:hypothetical protein